VLFTVGGGQQPALDVTDTFVTQVLTIAGLHWRLMEGCDKFVDDRDRLADSPRQGAGVWLCSADQARSSGLLGGRPRRVGGAVRGSGAGPGARIPGI
jgi:hypothetical protein